MRKRNKWIAAGVGLWLTGAVCIGSGVFLDNPSSALTRVVQAATQSETTQGQIDAANKKREQLEKERTELKKTLSSSESKKDNILQYIRSDELMINLLTAENIIDHHPLVRLMGGFKAARAVGHTVSIMKLSCDDSSICITGKAADFRLQACHMMAGFF